MVRVPLEELVLQIHLLCLGRAGPFLARVLQPPPERAVLAAVAGLQQVGALTPDEALTPLGHHLAQLPVDARVGKLLLLAAWLGCLAPCLTIAACLSYKPPFASALEQADAAAAARARLDQIDEERGAAQAGAAATRDALRSAEAALKGKKAERARVADGTRKAVAQREHYERKLDEVEGRLREAAAERKESERDRKMAAAVADMKRLLPGVHGRVTELARVSQRKYNLALTVLLGKEMDSVVVDDEVRRGVRGLGWGGGGLGLPLAGLGLGRAVVPGAC